MRICPKCQRKLPDFVAFCPDDGARLLDAGPQQETSSAESLVLDNRVVGSYRLVDLIAEGGMGCVFEAEHVKLGRRVAVKLLRPEFAGNQKAITRFFREARAVNEIQHPNIVEITDFVEDPDGDNFYVMELLEGQTLKELLAKTRPLPVPRMLGIAMQVTGALEAVHMAGIVHRDLKPDNIVLVEQKDGCEFVKLLDFGIAKMIRQIDDLPAQETVEGTVLGTSAYMSPEQAKGASVDFRTDIYSLGVILYEMTTGKKPIIGETFNETIYKQMTERPARPSRIEGLQISLPLHLEDIIMQCLEKDPEQRPQSMAEVEARLRQIGRSGSVQCEVSGSDIEPVKARPRRFLVTLGLVAVLAVAAGIFLVFGRGKDTRATPAKKQADAGMLASGQGGVDTSGSAASGTPLAESADRVELVFESRPPGASVYRRGSAESLGRTPLNLDLPRAERKEQFIFQLAGHVPERRELSLAKNGSLSVALESRKRKPRRRKKRVKKPPKKRKRRRRSGTGGEIDLGGTIDPFAE